MMLYHFTKKDAPREAAWTADKEGSTLPLREAWRYRFSQHADPEKMTAPDWQTIFADIQRDGYSLAHH